METFRQIVHLAMKVLIIEYMIQSVKLANAMLVIEI